MHATLIVTPASGIRVGDLVQGYYRPSVTLATAVHPNDRNPDWSDIDLRAGLIARPYPAPAAGLPALAALPSRRRFAPESPILVTRTRPSPEELGDAVGRIAGFAALSLHESFPDLSLERLAETFTTPAAVEMLSLSYMNGLASGLTPGESAAEAGTALIHGWAEARLEARRELDRQKAEEAARNPWGPMVVCWCGTQVRDNEDARHGHEDAWHTDRDPAAWSAV
ncbi:hypothetical protein ACFWAP_33600 [Streptomyces goshikiensis]|uniref:hypothetical protein n=1 Tax=Streptomyces goshikiensis TaxID=1942 RepID=UPI00365FDD0B